MTDAGRPRVILHILQSVDGRVAGAFFGEAAGCVGEYGRIRDELSVDCFVHGATTARQLYARGTVRPQRQAQVPPGDHVARRASRYMAVLDPDGTLGYDSPTCERRGMEGSHIVALLTEDVTAAYLGYLRAQHVSYVLCGRGRFDAGLAVKKLGSLFGVRRIALMGGGLADGTFAAADAIDELSLVVAPVAEVASGAPSLFETLPGIEARPIAWRLHEVRRLPDSGLWLHYLRNRDRTH